MIIPALLTNNERIAQERIALAKQMSGWLHVDVLDNTLYQFESLAVETLEKLDFGDLLLEFHCMTANPNRLVDSLLPLERVILDYDTPRWKEYYTTFTNKGLETWLAIDPSTPIEALEFPDDTSGAILMGVVPGQSGQSLLEGTYERLELLKEFYPDLPVTIDGGVAEDNIREFITRGVDNLVVGSAIFSEKNPINAYQRYVKLSDPLLDTPMNNEVNESEAV